MERKDSAALASLYVFHKINGNDQISQLVQIAIDSGPGNYAYDNIVRIFDDIIFIDLDGIERVISRANEIHDKLNSSQTNEHSSGPVSLYFTQKECVERYKYSASWFERCRWAGNGPPFLKVRGKILYPKTKTDKWFLENGTFKK